MPLRQSVMPAFFLPQVLEADLQAVDQLIQQRLRRHPMVANVAEPHMLKPDENLTLASLVLLCAQIGEYQLDRVLHAASAAELIFAATSTHNALVDEGRRRRGEYLQSKDVDPIALMVGNYLLALASGEMALNPDGRIINYYAQAVMQICEAELRPVTELLPTSQALKVYTDRAGSSLGAMYKAACQAGAACAQLTEAQIEALATFGYELGIARIIAQDLNDFQAADHTVRGESLRQGHVSLPLIFAARAENIEKLTATLNNESNADDAWAIAEIQASGIDAAHNELVLHIQNAQQALAILPESAARETLISFSQSILAN